MRASQYNYNEGSERSSVTRKNHVINNANCVAIRQFAYNPAHVYNVRVRVRVRARKSKLRSDAGSIGSQATTRRFECEPSDYKPVQPNEYYNANSVKIISVLKVPTNHNVHAVDRVCSMDKGKGEEFCGNSCATHTFFADEENQKVF